MKPFGSKSTPIKWFVFIISASGWTHFQAALRSPASDFHQVGESGDQDEDEENRFPTDDVTGRSKDDRTENLTEIKDAANQERLVAATNKASLRLSGSSSNQFFLLRGH